MAEARQRQAARFAEFPDIHSNALMPSQMVKDICRIDAAGLALLKTAMERLGLSARAYDRILKVARTIADLAATDEIELPAPGRSHPVPAASTGKAGRGEVNG